MTRRWKETLNKKDYRPHPLKKDYPELLLLGDKWFPIYNSNRVNLKFIRTNTKAVRSTYKLIDFLHANNNHVEDIMEN